MGKDQGHQGDIDIPNNLNYADLKIHRDPAE